MIDYLRHSLLYAGLLFAGYLLADSILDALDHEARYAEMSVVDRRAEICGPQYREDYRRAYARALAIGGQIVHETDCRIVVLKQGTTNDTK